MLTNHIKRYKKVFSKEKCDNIIKHIEYFENNSLLFSSNDPAGCDQFVRNLNQDYYDINLVYRHKVAGEILSNLQECTDDYLKTFSLLGKYPFLLTDLKLKKILEGGGFHNWHFENGSYEYSQRYFVIQVYLNDNFEGGETQFLHQGQIEKAVAGDVLIFPAGYTHAHRGNPPFGGVKYLATTWGWIQPTNV